MKVEYLKQAWLVLMLAGIFGGALAGVETRLRGRIDANKLDETYGQIPTLVSFVDNGRRKQADKDLTQEVTLGGKRVYKAFCKGPDGAGEHIGWVLRASGQGFADRIELLVGLDAKAETILGVYVLDQKETPGLGDKIRSEWSGRFAGKSATEDVRIVKTAPTGNQVQAITGATVSSTSVCRIVNVAVIEFRNALIRERILTQ